MIKLLFVDFSRTLASGSGCNIGGEYLGKGNAYKELYPKFQAGEVTMEELLTATFLDWKGLKLTDLPKIVETIRFSENAETSLKQIQDKGIKTALLSNIPIHLGQLIQEKFGFDYISGNVLEVIDGVFTGNVLEFHTQKQVDAKHLLELAKVSTNEAAMIGDRKDDAEVFKNISFGVSYSGDEAANKAAKYQIDDWADLPSLLN